MNDEKRSASLAGSGKLSGGDYTRVSISGAGKVSGDLKAEALKISGAGKVEGKTEALQIAVSGSGAFAGDVVSDEMRVSGAARIDGVAKVKELKCSGSYRVKDGISAEYVKISGVLRVGGDVEADLFKASGGFEIEGLLSADKLEIRPGGRCYAREIGGERIDVRRGGHRERGILLDGLVRMFSGRGTAELKANVIEGDEIHLEDTTAEVVRGKRIEIGPGCRISAVEYSERLDVHPDAEVKDQKKV